MANVEEDATRENGGSQEQELKQRLIDVLLDMKAAAK